MYHAYPPFKDCTAFYGGPLASDKHHWGKVQPSQLASDGYTSCVRVTERQALVALAAVACMQSKVQALECSCVTARVRHALAKPAAVYSSLAVKT